MGGEEYFSCVSEQRDIVDSGETPEGKEESVVLKSQLEKIYPDLILDVELPSSVNGNNFQIRSNIFGAMFIGRASTEEEALDRMCGKVIKYIKQHNLGPYETSEGPADNEEKVVRERRRRNIGGRGRRRRGGETSEKNAGDEERKNKKKRRKNEKSYFEELCEDLEDYDYEEIDFASFPIKNAVMMLNEMFP